ncbi:MAG: hypothetical protein AAF901_11685, partial [Bacteroidota bacterium]
MSIKNTKYISFIFQKTYIYIEFNKQLINNTIMPLSANNPNRTSWLYVNKYSDFPIQNIPF